MQFETIPPLSSIVGKRLTGVEKRRDSFWAFIFEGGLSVMADHWRLIKGDRVTLTERDDGQLFGRHLYPIDAAYFVSVELQGAAVTRVELSAVSDLLLSFTNERCLQVMVVSAWEGSWHAYGPNRLHVMENGGGELLWIAP